MQNDFNEQDFFSPAASGRAPKPNPNPLAAYFRTPGLHVRLPSGGRYLPHGAIEFTAAGDVPVYPMRAADELLMKAPDALMSGYAIEKMIESCIPAIKVPGGLVSTADLDVILLAVRAASHGDNLEIFLKCPKCGEENSFDASISRILGTLKETPAENAVRLSDDLVAHVRPFNVRNMTKIQLTSFETARTLQMLEDKPDAEKIKAMNNGYQKLATLEIEMISECVIKIATPAGDVTDRAQIKEFVNDAASERTKKLSDKMKELNDYHLDRTVTAHCAKCGNEWDANVEVDPANFFVQGS